MIFALHEHHLPHSSAIKNNMNIKPTWTSTHRRLSRAIWRQLECAKKMLKWEVVMFLLYCRAHVSVFTLINGCHSNAKFV